MTAPVRVLVVDDHTLFRRGLIALLGQYDSVTVVGEAGDAGEAQRRAAALQPDLILLDNHLPGVRGVDALPGLREVAPATRVLMLTMSEDVDDLATALRGGAQGYLLKSTDGDALIDAIVRAMAGHSVISPELTATLADALRGSAAAGPPPAQAPATTDALQSLSPREREIVAKIAQGASNKEIARALDIAETTVKIHVQHVLRKLDLTSRVQVAVFASQQGLKPDT